LTEAEVFVKDPFVKKEYLRQGVLLLRPKLYRKTDDGVSLRRVLPVHADDGALLFGLKLSVIGLKRRFRDDRTADPALGLCKGAWFHRHTPAIVAYDSVVPPYTARLIKHSALTALSAGVHIAQSDPTRFGCLSVL
jgi:hypothetical protein